MDYDDTLHGVKGNRKQLELDDSRLASENRKQQAKPVSVISRLVCLEDLVVVMVQGLMAEFEPEDRARVLARVALVARGTFDTGWYTPSENKS